MSKIDTDTKISYKEKMEEEYRILCSVCRKYDYRVEYKFDQFFIYTKYEVWCYEIKSGKRILLHGNLLYGKGGIKESGRWHHQKMCGCRSVDDIVKKFMNMKSGNMVDWNSNKLTNKKQH